MTCSSEEKTLPFQAWVDAQPAPEGKAFPFTHITRGVIAQKIMAKGQIDPRDCPNFGVPLAYFFYGRPAYRANSDKIITLEGSSPFCFVFSDDLIREASQTYPFDTGALSNRLYSHILDEGLEPADFELGANLTRLAKLVSASFESREAYFLADRSKVRNPDEVSRPWDMQARAFLELISSFGRNGPDDRVSTIEAVCSGPVQLDHKLLAIVVPHTVWDDEKEAMPLLIELRQRDVRIATYPFTPGRPPEQYQAAIEGALRELYVEWGYL